MIFAILALGMAAILGLSMAFTLITKSENPTWWTAIAHGLFAVVGVVLVLIVLVDNSELLLLRTSLVLFLATALAGLGLFSVHLRGRRIAMRYVLAHASLGVLAFALLIVSAFNIGM